MWEWLLTPIDPDRVHEVGFAVSWHARSMTLAWGVLAPLAILIARFFKVMPGQEFPNELDNQVWWRSHWIGASLVLMFTIFGIGLILPEAGEIGWHGILGYCVLGLVLGQVTLGLFRGSKGGPTSPASDGSLHGDHYDMTPRRKTFEALHKSMGYMLLLLAAMVLVQGLWQANAPNWMWLSIALWWSALCWAFVVLQQSGKAIDTYQAIWGPDPRHPGNQQEQKGWGMQRIYTDGGEHLRHD